MRRVIDSSSSQPEQSRGSCIDDDALESFDHPSEGSDGPLEGVRVLEAGTLIAGPFGGRLLADLGAEVIKIEDPRRPDPMREWGSEEYNGHPLWWPVQSRNKKLIALDLRKGQGLFLDLVRESDVLLENFRPGTLEKWNLGYERLREVNPGLVLARVSGFGQTGPYSRRGGFASVAEAMGGLRYINGYPDQPPPRTGISLGDSLAGMFAAIGILAALRRRDADTQGRGQVVDISLMESSFALLESVIPEYDRLGLVRKPSGTGLKGVAPSNIFKAKDGKWVVIAANQDELFRELCAAMGKPELAEDERFATHRARAQHQEEIEKIVAAWAHQHDAFTIHDLLNDAGVVCGPVYSAADIVEDPQYQARDMLVPHEDSVLGSFLGPGVVPKFSETPGSVRWPGEWKLGFHNADVYGRILGKNDNELARLHKDGVI